MFSLILGLLILGACWRVWRKDLLSLRKLVIIKEEELGDLNRENEFIKAQVGDLNSKLEGLLAVYDISHELSKPLDSKKTEEVFLEKLQKALKLTDCFLAPNDAHKVERKSCKYLPVCVENEDTRYLVIDSDSKVNTNLLTLVVNQLTLGLTRAKLYQEVQKLAITDGLTGVYTRRYFLEKINQELKRAKARSLVVSFLMLDIDYFKSYNDTFGHVTGDALLKEVAAIIISNLRLVDICCRWGGEEFCILLPETEKDGAFLVAERLRSNLEETRIDVYDEHLKLTVSIGVAVYPEAGQKIELLIGKADQALYQAKKSGRNRVCVYGTKV